MHAPSRLPLPLVTMVLLFSLPVQAPAQEACRAPDGPCQVTVDSPSGTHDSLQRAVDKARNGATITVEGTCRGRVDIDDKRDLTIQGVPPEGGDCPAEGLDSGDLVSTVRGSGRDVIRIHDSRDITIRWLNIVDGDVGVEVNDSRGSVVTCNCIAGNDDEGVEIDDAKSNEVTRNLITENGEDGVFLHDEAKGNLVCATPSSTTMMTASRRRMAATTIRSPRMG